MSTNFSADEPDFSDWISQAEAAELHGVTRQAISKLARAGRLKTLELGGHVLVSRTDVLGLRKRTAGRPSQRENRVVGRILEAIDNCDPETRTEILRRLREQYPVHVLETMLNAPAEVILEAIYRAGPLTLQGIRGVLAESAFRLNVASRLRGWNDLPVEGDQPYDFVLDDGNGAIKIQVKLQRKKDGKPMRASQGYRWLSPEMYAVETQRTRGGKDSRSGEDARPYRFGEFDLLAVAMEPSMNRWDYFMYTLSDWLLPRPENPMLLLKFQPVPSVPNEDWTDDFETCAAWFRSSVKKTIQGA